MKCTNYAAAVRQLDDTATLELVRAVRAHGGSYRFTKDGPGPVVPVPDGPHPLLRVTAVRYSDCELHILGVPVGTDGDERELPVNAMSRYYLWQMTEAMEDAGTIHDVTADDGSRLDPAILVDLTQAAWGALRALGVNGDKLSDELVKRAGRLSFKYRDASRDHACFRAAMDREARSFIHDVCLAYGIGDVNVMAG